MENLNSVLKSNDLSQIVMYKLRQLFWRKLGWQGILGIFLILLGLSYQLFISIPKSQNLELLQAELITLKAKPKLKTIERSQNEQSDVTKLFYDVLPIQTEANQKISEMLSVATDNGLVVSKVEYEQPLTVSPLIQYQIKLPLTGNYLQIRQFINQVLNTLPSIALTDISLKREDIASDMIDAQIQFTLYLQKGQQ